MANEPLTLEAPNGQRVIAPLGVWILALYDLMPNADRSALFERVLAFRDEIVAHPVGREGKLMGFDPDSLPIRLVGSNVPNVQTTLGKVPSRTQYDRDGKKHIRMYAEKGTYFDTKDPIKDKDLEQEADEKALLNHNQGGKVH